MGRLLKAKYAFWPLTNLFQLDLVMGLHYYHFNGAFPKERLVALQKLGEKQKRKIRLIQGHMGFGTHEYFPQPCQYITVLREPVSRVLSQYHQMRQQDWCPYKKEIRSLPLDKFIESHPIDALTNYQVKMIAGRNSGMPGDTTPYDISPSDPALLVQAQENIDKHYLVVLTEKFDESVLLMQKKLNWRNAYYIRSNVTKSRKRKADYDEALIDIIRENNKLDIELYDQALKNMNAEIADLGDAFQDNLRKFRATNGRLQKYCYGPIDWLLNTGRSIHVSRNRKNMRSDLESR